MGIGVFSLMMKARKSEVIARRCGTPSRRLDEGSDTVISCHIRYGRHRRHLATSATRPTVDADEGCRIPRQSAFICVHLRLNILLQNELGRADSKWNQPQMNADKSGLS
jgi:hypothetical protein